MCRSVSEFFITKDYNLNLQRARRDLCEICRDRRRAGMSLAAPIAPVSPVTPPPNTPLAPPSASGAGTPPATPSTPVPPAFPPPSSAGGAPRAVTPPASSPPAAAGGSSVPPPPPVPTSVAAATDRPSAPVECDRVNPSGLLPIRLLREVLVRHDYDSRYQNGEVKASLAALYFPFVAKVGVCRFYVDIMCVDIMSILCVSILCRYYVCRYYVNIMCVDIMSILCVDIMSILSLIDGYAIYRDSLPQEQYEMQLITMWIITHVAPPVLRKWWLQLVITRKEHFVTFLSDVMNHFEVNALMSFLATRERVEGQRQQQDEVKRIVESYAASMTGTQRIRSYRDGRALQANTVRGRTFKRPTITMMAAASAAAAAGGSIHIPVSPSSAAHPTPAAPSSSSGAAAAAGESEAPAAPASASAGAEPATAGSIADAIAEAAADPVPMPVGPLTQRELEQQMNLMRTQRHTPIARTLSVEVSHTILLVLADLLASVTPSLDQQQAGGHGQLGTVMLLGQSGQPMLYTSATMEQLMKLAWSLLLAFLKIPQGEDVYKTYYCLLRNFVASFPRMFFLDDTRFCAELCLDLMRHCVLYMPEARIQATAMIYLLLRTNFEMSGSVSRVLVQVTVALSQLKGLTPVHEELIIGCLDSLKRYAALPQTLGAPEVPDGSAAPAAQPVALREMWAGFDYLISTTDGPPLPFRALQVVLNQGDRIAVLAEDAAGPGWSRVRNLSTGMEGYCPHAYLVDTPPQKVTSEAGPSKTPPHGATLGPISREELAAQERARIFVNHIEKLAIVLTKVAKDTIAVEGLTNLDTDLTADLQWRLAEGYTHTPELRVLWLDRLVELHQDKNNWDEAAVALIFKAAVIAEHLESLRSAGKQAQPMQPALLSQRVHCERCGDRPHCDTCLRTHTELCQGRLQCAHCAWYFIMRSIVPAVRLALGVGKEGASDASAAQNQASIFTAQNLLQTYHEALRMLAKAGMYESQLDLYRCLLPHYEADCKYTELAACFQDMAQSATIISEQCVEARLRHTYYRVGFYGKNHEDNGLEFIYKMSSFAKLGQIMEMFQEYFVKRGRPTPDFITESKKVDLTTLNPEKTYIQLTNVEPYLDEDELKQRPTAFAQKTILRRFVFNTPYTKGPKAMGPMHEQWRRKTILEIELNPLLNSLEDIRVRTRSLRESRQALQAAAAAAAAVTSVPAAAGASGRTAQAAASAALAGSEEAMKAAEVVSGALKTMQRQLNGSVVPQVNQGPMAIFRCFLVQHKEEFTPEDLAQLRTEFAEFLKECRSCLELNEMHAVTTQALQMQRTLAQAFNSIVEEVGTTCEEVIAPYPVSRGGLEDQGETEEERQLKMLLKEQAMAGMAKKPTATPPPPSTPKPSSDAPTPSPAPLDTPTPSARPNPDDDFLVVDTASTDGDRSRSRTPNA
ncbi:putative dedicator of cytokinesis protein 7 [Paratrimastix pyriformis]|uniref:Dedicator of cytokinesis protein 7 n=1 Tax=Paratrimastix pyriformis TaxID=342808 RepID=A0ABQ8UAH6_9EUKA|nr:putative dedicator of cytokinesis protein 7 [Paratrimastix pyriformis]